MEVWKVSNEFEELEVSNLGQVIWTKDKKPLKIRPGKDAVYVQFRIDRYQTSRRVKIMIARAFLSPSDYNHVVCKDGNMLNVAASNLEYRSSSKPYKLKKDRLPPDYKWLEDIRRQVKEYDDKLNPFKN